MFHEGHHGRGGIDDHHPQFVELRIIGPLCEPDDQVFGSEMLICGLADGIVFLIGEHAQDGVRGFCTELPEGMVIRAGVFMDLKIGLAEDLHRWVHHHKLHRPLLLFQLVGQGHRLVLPSEYQDLLLRVEGAVGSHMNLTGKVQGPFEDGRSHDLVENDHRDQNGGDLIPPPGKLGSDHRGQTEADPGLGDIRHP